MRMTECERRYHARKMTSDDLARIAQGYHAMAWEAFLRGDFRAERDVRELRDWYEGEAAARGDTQ